MLQSMSDPKVDALSKVPLFASLSKHELEFVASRADEVDAPSGKFLTTQGEPGDTFGEISMLDRGLGTATITTTKPSRLLVMSHAQFRDAIKANDALLIKVLAAMGERLRADLAARHQHD